MHIGGWGGDGEDHTLIWGANKAEMATDAPRGMGGDGDEPVAIKPNETAMNPWQEAKIKGNEPLA